MKKWVLFALIALFFVAVFTRLYPLTQYEIWGCDTGEYYYLTNQLTSEGYISTDYDGWGFGYPYFPGLYDLSGSVHLLTGMDNIMALTVIIPAASALSVLVVFVIARLLFRNDAAGLLAGGFTAVAMPHVFAASHPMPGALGDVLFLSCLLLLLASYKNRKFIPLLILTVLALTITHHLSSYFLLIAVFGGVFFEEFFRGEERKDARISWAFLVFLLTVLLLYWTLYAVPFGEKVVSMAFDLPSWMLFVFGYLAIFLAYILVKLRRRLSWSYQPNYPKTRAQLVKYLVLLAVLFSTLLLMVIGGVPGTDVQLTPWVVLLFSPFLVLIGFISVGGGYADFHWKGIAIYGWIVAIALSLLVAVVTSNRVLLSFRHPQYVIAFLGLLIGIGVAMILKTLDHDKKPLKKMVSVGIVIAFLGLTSLSAYPPQEVFGGFQEGTSEEDMQAVLWAKASLHEGATIASDHRMSSMLFGFAEVNATWGAAEKTMHAASYEECRDELENVTTPSGKKPIDYILLDDDIKKGVMLVAWENAQPMSLDAQKKFELYPFVKLYEANGVEVYGVVG